MLTGQRLKLETDPSFWFRGIVSGSEAASLGAVGSGFRVKFREGFRGLGFTV